MPSPTPVRASRVTITPGEICFALGISLAVLAITSLPYVFGYMTSPADKQFTGLVINVPDHCQYFAWLKGFRSALLISNTLTPEPNPPVFFNLLWWALAQVGNLTGLGYAALYQIFRWVAGISFLLALYGFYALVFDDCPRRRFAFLLTTFASGLGWILVVLKYTLTGGVLLHPLDVYVAEGNTFVCILGYPHFLFALAFILCVFELVLIGQRRNQLRYAVAAGIMTLALGWQHGYDLIIICGVLGAYGLLVALRERAWPRYLIKAGLIVGILSVWPAVYNVCLTTVNPLWSEVLAQFANANVYTPDPLHLTVLFGLPLIVACFAWVRSLWLRGWDRPMLFVQVWFLVGFLLNYIPTDFQIHMLNSWQVPVMILATKGVYDFIVPALGRWKSGNGERVRRLAVMLFVLAVLPTNIYLWAWRFVDLNRHDYPYYLYRDEVAAMEWLAERAPADAVVLSSLETGQYLPASGGQRAFLAHWAQTVRFYDKSSRVARFFDVQTEDMERLETLQAFGVDYVFYGPAERVLGEYDPSTSSLFELVFSSSRVKVYRVEDHSHRAAH
jgi:uncharacterized membrane protein